MDHPAIINKAVTVANENHHIDHGNDHAIITTKNKIEPVPVMVVVVVAVTITTRENAAMSENMPMAVATVVQWVIWAVVVVMAGATNQILAVARSPVQPLRARGNTMIVRVRRIK